MSRLIDADKLKAHYSWWANSTNYDLCEMKHVVDDIVDVQPTVDTERHAHWEWDDELSANVCSECGRPTYDSHDEYVEIMGSKVQALVSPYYCGYCGAKMDGVEDEAD